MGQCITGAQKNAEKEEAGNWIERERDKMGKRWVRTFKKELVIVVYRSWCEQLISLGQS